jgi:hypothetical protein
VPRLRRGTPCRKGRRAAAKAIGPNKLHRLFDAAQRGETRYLHGMSALKARVENGRLKLDEPTDLPEGQVIELIPLDEVIATGGDDLDDEERAALHRSIDESMDDEQAGNVEDLSKIIAELRVQL